MRMSPANKMAGVEGMKASYGDAASLLTIAEKNQRYRFPAS